MSTTAIDPQQRWRLEDIFEDDAAFEAARDRFADDVGRLERFRGQVASTPAALADALDAVHEAARTLRHLHCFAALRSDGDTRHAGHQAARQSIDRLATEFSGHSSYLRPEILAVTSETIEAAIEAEPRLAPYAFYLRDLMRQRDHVLGEAEERILAESGLIRRDAGALYQMLTNAELPRHEVELESGERVTVGPVEYQKRRTSAVRDDRRRLVQAYLGSYADFRETFGMNLNAAVKSHLFVARSRRYASCLDASLAADNVPRAVYENLIGRVREHLPLLQRYLRLRATRLGVPRLEPWDLHCPLVDGPGPSYSPDRTAEIVREAMAPLGERYAAALDEAFGGRWIDWHPAPGKRSGAYATGWAYDVHPYVLLNFTGDHESVMTVAHELGHALHSRFSNARQPFATADYSIFVAEVASTFNEALVLEHLLEHADSADEQRRLLAGYLDGIRGTLYRQTMFAEFELAIHERVERGGVLTGESLDELYLGLLREQHGHDEGVIDVGSWCAVEWAAIPHMYYDFYVYQYATGIVAATALARQVLERRDGAVERYLRFLESGGSDHPLELLRAAGVDLERAEPYDDAFALIGQKIDQLEALGPGDDAAD